ncbi:MAG: right-handed parallel beta-helix repeat-containing protein [Faecousia sp.]
MKSNKLMITAALLSLSLLAGCASSTAAQETQTTPPESIPETIAVTPETTSPVVVPEEPKATEAAPGETAPFQVEITPVITQTQNQVTVSTADEFLAAIASNTEILLDAELIDLSEAAGYGQTDGDFYYWSEGYDGPELRIANVSNLTIRGTGENHDANVLSCVPRYAYVLTFENCSNIYTVGFTAGHTKEPGSCMGGVLCFRNSQDILVEDCGLFGCGTLGVMGESSKNMQIVNNEIYECSVGGVEFTNCDAVNVDGNTFRDLGGPIFRIYDCGTITCNGENAVPFQ